MPKLHQSRSDRRAFQLGQLNAVLRMVKALSQSGEVVPRTKEDIKASIRKEIGKRAAVLGRARYAHGQEGSRQAGLAIAARHQENKARAAARKRSSERVVDEFRHAIERSESGSRHSQLVAHQFFLQMPEPAPIDAVSERLRSGLAIESQTLETLRLRITPTSQAKTNRSFSVIVESHSAAPPSSQIAATLRTITGARSVVHVPTVELSRFHRFVERAFGSKSKTTQTHGIPGRRTETCRCDCCCECGHERDPTHGNPPGASPRPTWVGIPDDTEWHLKQMRVKEAWRLPPPAGGRSRGEGIIIAHPDTGWREHPEYDQGQLRFDLARNVIDATTGRDATRHGTVTIPVARYETHGTGTGVTIVSAEAHPQRTVVSDIPQSNLVATSSNVQLTGVAPRAQVVPIRCTDTTVLLMDPNITRAIEHAIDIGAHVISISLGGLLPRDCEIAIDRAVEQNIIVVAAAGQVVNVGRNSVIEPAIFRNVIAVAGSTPELEPWDGSCNGPSVAVSAPAKGVWFAGHFLDGTSGIYWGDGTSFSAAAVAGVAALWLAHWDRASLIARYPGVPLAHVFQQVLRNTAFRPRTWNASYGAGIVDAFAVLSEPLPAASEVVAPIGSTEFNLFDEFSEWLDFGGAIAADVWGTLMDAGGAVGDFFGEVFTSGLLAEGLAEIGAAAGAAVGGVQAWLNEQAGVVSGMIDESLAAAGDAWDDVVDAGEDAVETVGDLVEGAGDVMEEVGEAAEDTWNDAVDIFTSFF